MMMKIHPSIRSSGLLAWKTLLEGASLLEIPREYLDCLECKARIVREASGREGGAGAYQREWDTVYRRADSNPSYDFWLERYEQALQEARDLPVIDLGCGYGNDSMYLAERRFSVISCDYSEEALKRLSRIMERPSVKRCDLIDGLPFSDGTSRLVIANLSLHYFSWADTERITAEIRRVLTPGGRLLCRVNSTNDRENGAGQGRLLEKNFFDIDGKRKRFFDRPALLALFQGWEIEKLEEKSIERFGKNKLFWELAARKA